MGWRWFWRQAYFLSLLILTTEAQTCGVADTTLPEFPLLTPTETKSFRGFTPRQSEFSSTIADMYRENGLTRQCIAWQETPGRGCWLYMECRSIACFGHLYEETLDPDASFTVELYGYAMNDAWIAVAFSKTSDMPPVDAFQVECIRDSSNNAIVQASYIDPAGIRTLLPRNEVRNFLSLKTHIADPFFKNHFYCKIYMKVKLQLSTGMVLDFANQPYYTVSSVGERYQALSPTEYNLLEPCSMPPPKFPVYVFRPYEVSEGDKVYFSIHGCLMVIVFVILFPCSLYPVRYLKFSQDNENPKYHMKQWLISHLIFAIWVYPVMFISVVFARRGRDDQFRYPTYTNSSFGHGTAGVLCYQIFSVQFYIGLFAYPFLRMTTNKVLVRFHYVFNYFGYMIAAHIISMIKIGRYMGVSSHFYGAYHLFLYYEFFVHFFMTFYHFIMRIVPTDDPKFFRHAHIHTFMQILCQDTKEVQRQPYAIVYQIMWRWHFYGCCVFAIWMISSVNVGPRYHQGSRVLTPDIYFMGQFFIDWDYNWIWLF